MNLYFDNASTSFPKSSAVSDAVAQYLSDGCGSASRGAYGRSIAATQIVEQCRDAMAGVMGVSTAEHLFFTSGATSAANCVLQGAGLGAHDRVLVSPMEHNAIMRPLYALGVRIEVMPHTNHGVIDVEALQNIDHQGITMVVVNHSSNVNGATQPVDAICHWVHSHGLKVAIDTSQSAGHIAIQGDIWGVDYLIFTGHKGLGGPTGIGGFYAKEPSSLRPLIYGGTGSRSDSYAMPDIYPDRMEAGTANVTGAAGLLAAIKSPLTPAHSTHDYEQLLVELSTIDQLTIYSGSTDVELFSITCRQASSAALCEKLYRQSGIETRSGLHCAPLAHRTLGTLATGTLRISLSRSHTLREMELLHQSIVAVCR